MSIYYCTTSIPVFSRLLSATSRVLQPEPPLMGGPKPVSCENHGQSSDRYTLLFKEMGIDMRDEKIVPPELEITEMRSTNIVGIPMDYTIIKIQ